jgi:hypothetical protein
LIAKNTENVTKEGFFAADDEPMSGYEMRARGLLDTYQSSHNFYPTI